MSTLSLEGPPDATPLPGASGMDVIQVLHMRGLLTTGTLKPEQTCITPPNSLNEKLEAALQLPGVQRIAAQVKPFWQRSDRRPYIEAFLTALKAHSADPDVRRLLDVFAATPSLSTPDDVGPGYTAVYFYMQDPRASWAA